MLLYHRFQGAFSHEVSLSRPDNGTGSISHSLQIKIVMEVRVMAGKPSYILSTLKIMKFCSLLVVKVI